MEVIPIRIPRIPHLSNHITRPHFRSLTRSKLGEVCIIRIDCLSVREGVFDRDNVSPSCLPSSRHHIPIPDRTNGGSLCGCDIQSEMTSISHIPPIRIRRPPEHRVDTAIFFIVLEFRIISTRYLRKRHLTAVVERTPSRVPTRGLRYLIERIHKRSSRSNLSSHYEGKKEKDIFFHMDFRGRKIISCMISCMADYANKCL